MAGGETRGAIEVADVVVGFGERVVLDHLSLNVRRGEVLGFVGGSGSGKSVLLRTIIGLLPKRAGRIEVLGNHTDYNEGFVFSAAINTGTFFAASKSATKSCRLMTAS